ncbi:hypothetical protein [Paraburkholderia bannensis]|uniref:hypothetical protein n=1 Tax=Paraburkholderia bannensis TaxID=765414 RepID=UPI002AC34C2B|nr:hypothetical protein [Paraburkholderia bannensis]
MDVAAALNGSRSIDNLFHDYNMEQQSDILSDCYAIHVENNYSFIYHDGPVVTRGQLKWVMAQFIRNRKNADTLQK